MKIDLEAHDQEEDKTDSLESGHQSIWSVISSKFEAALKDLHPTPGRLATKGLHQP